MSTVYDFVTLVIFAGLAILFLHRSVGPENPNDRIYHYIPPALGCALANWLGNKHQDILAVVLIVGILAYIYFGLKPFGQRTK